MGFEIFGALERGGEGEEGGGKEKQMLMRASICRTLHGN